jgi:Flp pilus assembly pilin Flp
MVNVGLSRPFRRLVPEQATNLWCDERGAAAVEFAMVLPFLVMLLLGIIQYGSLFLLQREMHDAARETARGMALGALKTESDAEEFALARLANWSGRFRAQAEFPDPPDHDVTVVISVPMGEAALLNIVDIGMEGDLTAEVHMFME